MSENRKSQLFIILSDPQTRRYLEELLTRDEFRLEFCQDPENAQKIAHGLLPDAILLDADLDIETCRRLRGDSHLAGVPILVMLDAHDRKAKAQALDAGADDFISKPFDALELLARLHTLTRLHYYDKMFADLERFEWMTAHAQEGYLILDGISRIQYANERAINMLNLPENPIGLDFVTEVHAHYIARPTETWQAWLNDPSPCFLMRPENINSRAFWMMLEALDTDIGAETQRIVRLRDVTEKMSIYQDIRRFHDTITHKLRTPVSLLATSVSLINSHLDQLSAEEIRELMQTAVKGAERLVWQVRDVLTYIDAPLALNLGDPTEIRQLPEIIQNISQKFGINSLSLSLPESLAVTRVAMTPDALELVMSEALENTKKFHPERSPTVDISIGRIEDDLIRIRITDDGVTLSAEQLSWAWLPYFQGEKSFTGELPGMGLGFPLMATLVWGVGGSLRLSNRPDGPGIIVEINLPIIKTSPGVPAPETSQS